MLGCFQSICLLARVLSCLLEHAIRKSVKSFLLSSNENEMLEGSYIKGVKLFAREWGTSNGRTSCMKRNKDVWLKRQWTTKKLPNTEECFFPCNLYLLFNLKQMKPEVCSNHFFKIYLSLFHRSSLHRLLGLLHLELGRKKKK